MGNTIAIPYGNAHIDYDAPYQGLLTSRVEQEMACPVSIAPLAELENKLGPEIAGK